MYLMEIAIKDRKDTTKLPPQHIMERIAKLMAAVMAEELGESHVYYGERLGGSVNANGEIAPERWSAVWALVDAAAFDAVLLPVHAVAVSIAEAQKQLAVSFQVVDVAGKLHCTPRNQHVPFVA